MYIRLLCSLGFLEYEKLLQGFLQGVKAGNHCVSIRIQDEEKSKVCVFIHFHKYLGHLFIISLRGIGQVWA